MPRYGGWRAGFKCPEGKGKPDFVQSLPSVPLLRLGATPLLERTCLPEISQGLGSSLKGFGWTCALVKSRHPSPSKLLPGRWLGGGLFGV